MKRFLPGWVKWPQLDVPLLLGLLLLMTFGLFVLYSAVGLKECGLLCSRCDVVPVPYQRGLRGAT